jgi:hypothetical protein
VNAHILHTFGILAHSLRCDEDELPTYRPTSSPDHHLHTDLSVRAVHENIKLIKTADGRSHGFPDGKQQADCRERLLSTRKSLGLTAFVTVLRHVRFDTDIQHLIRVIDKKATTEVAFAQEVSEGDSCSCRDVPAELSPAILAEYQRLLEFLLHKCQYRINLQMVQVLTYRCCIFLFVQLLLNVVERFVCGPPGLVDLLATTTDTVSLLAATHEVWVTDTCLASYRS